MGYSTTGRLSIAREGVELELNSPSDCDWGLKFYDLKGDQVLEKQIEFNGERGFAKISNLKAGSYVMTLVSPEGKRVQTVPMAWP